ncbi:MAG: zinc-dependent metalloprotease [Kineosporiaceae bacterium]
MSGNLPDRPDPDDENHDADGPGEDPLADMLRALLGGLGGAGGDLPAELPAELRDMLANIPGMPTDAASVQAMFSQVQRLMSTTDNGPVNWEAATQIARHVAAQDGDPSLTESQERAVAEAMRTADLWLDRVTDLPPATARTHAWSRAEWVEQTLPTWKGVVEPIADSVATALTNALTSQTPEQMRPMIGQALPMMRSMAGSFFGMQLGQAIGALSREVVGGGDTGLPLLSPGRVALIPTNVTDYGDGLELPIDEVRLYLALREAAFARLVSAVPWLRPHILALVTDYARGIQIDTERIEQAVREIDPTDAEALQNALSSGLFEPSRTPEQQAALDRLEVALALVEGWVDEVVHAAAAGSLPHAEALRETLRRRRAAGGPAEHTFASLVGLELRPRRLREAAAVWAALTAERGVGGRDTLWSHPDLVPSAEAFADPAGFARGGSQAAEGAGGDAMDAALAELLDAAAREDGDTPGDGERS